MTIIWGERAPGSLATQVDDLDGSSAVIIGHTQPSDYVKFPDGHPSAGESTKIQARVYAPCPKCGVECIHYVLEAVTNYVAECSKECGFVWYKRQQEA